MLLWYQLLLNYLLRAILVSPPLSPHPVALPPSIHTRFASCHVPDTANSGLSRRLTRYPFHKP